MRLVSGVSEGNLKKVLERVLKSQKDFNRDLTEVKKEIERVNEAGRVHIQNVGVVRFNPFGEIGGSHSFSIALLDEDSNGFVLTGLHARDKTRVYLKPVKKGKSSYSFSREEQKAIKIALEKK